MRMVSVDRPCRSRFVMEAPWSLSLKRRPAFSRVAREDGCAKLQGSIACVIGDSMRQAAAESIFGVGMVRVSLSDVCIWLMVESRNLIVFL